MRRLIITWISLAIIASPAIADEIYYCNATDAALTVFHEVPNDPVYTQRVDPAWPSFKFKRQARSIVIKYDAYTQEVPYYSTSFDSLRLRGNDFFFAAEGFNQFAYSDGKVIWNTFGHIISADCDKF